MVQILRPNSDITMTNVTGVSVNTAGNRHQNVDESTPSNFDYIEGNTNTNAVAECGLTAGSDPNIHTGHIVKFNYAKVLGTGSVNLSFGLYQGATLIAQKAVAPSITGSFVSDSFTLSEAEAANITDYAALSVRFNQTAASGRKGCVSWWEVELPDVVVLTRYVPAFNM